MKQALIVLTCTVVLFCTCTKDDARTADNAEGNTDTTITQENLSTDPDTPLVQENRNTGLDNIASPPEAQTSLNKTMFVNATAGLRVRDTPSLDGNRLGSLDFGTVVTPVKEDGEAVNIDGVEGKWVYLESPVAGWVFDGYLVNTPVSDANENIEPQGEASAYVIKQIELKRRLKDYFYLSGEYFSLDGKDTLLYINFLDAWIYLKVYTTDRRNDPNYLGITAISKDGNDYTITVLDEDGFDDYQMLTSERQIRITRLDGNEYEVNVLSSNASKDLDFLDKKRFRKEETLTGFTPTHFVARADVPDEMVEYAFLYDSKDAEFDSGHIIITGSLVELVDSTNTNNDKQRVRIRYESNRQISYAWIDGSKLERF